jgi:hypothetical protein
MIKKLKWAVIGLLLIVLLAVGVVWWMLDSIAQQGLERGTTYALGVPTHVGSVTVALFGGNVGMKQFTVDNPKQFKAPYITTLKSFNLDVKTASVFSDVIVVPKIELEGLEVFIEEKDGTTNVSAITENLKRLSKPADPNAPPRPEQGPKVRVGKLVIKNLVAHVTQFPVGAVDVPIPLIELNDVTPGNANGLAISELTRRIAPAILAAIVDKGAGIIPAGLNTILKGDVMGMAASLGGDASKLIGQVGGDLTKDLGKTIEGVTGGLKGIGDLGKVLGGDKTPATPTPDGTKPTPSKDPAKDLTGGLKGLLDKK